MLQLLEEYINAMFVSEGLCQISSLGQRGNYFLITNQTKGDAIAIHHLLPTACPS